MTRALVFYLYGPRNAGDMAICLGTIGFLRRRGVDVTMVSRFDEGAPDFAQSVRLVRGYYPEVEVVPGFFRLDRGAGRASLAASYAAGVTKCLLPSADPRLLGLIENADVVFFNGGNLLRCAGLIDVARLEALFYPVRVAKKTGKRVVCLPQSTATVSPRWRGLLERKLSFFDEVYVREPVSLARLRALYPKREFKGSTDMAFFMDDPLGAPRESCGCAAMIVRGSGIGDIGELPAARREELLGAYLRFAVEHPELRYTVVVQTEKDRALSEMLLEELPDDSELVEEHDAFRLLSVYRRMDVTLSMRLHAAILSLRAGTPVVGLFDEEWGLKNIGVMGDYDMGYSNDADGLLREYERTKGSFDPTALEATIAARERDLACALGF